VYIDRVSDIRNRFLTSTSDSIKDTILNDTIFGNPYCSIDTLSIKIKDGIDTIHYKIILNTKDIPSQVKLLTKSIEIFPNPVGDFININVTDLNISKTTIEIYNSTGSLIKILDRSNTDRYCVGDLKPGIYVIELFDNDKRFMSKIIKK